MKLWARFREYTPLRVMREACRTLSNQFGFNLRWVRGIWALFCFGREYHVYQGLSRSNPEFTIAAARIIPCLTDRTTATPVEPVYFLQDTWLARKVAERRPETHVDVGSSAKSIALLAQFVPVTFVDIRPVDIEVPGFTFLQGSILSLPFNDASIQSLSSICVIEHIGLGRYGDPFDASGSEKSASELCRVLGRGGHLYVTVPVDDVCRIYFNAHRAFTRDYLISLFPGLELLEERYIYGRKLWPAYEPDRGFGTGLFHFARR